jgi:hypothetical protein
MPGFTLEATRPALPNLYQGLVKALSPLCPPFCNRALRWPLSYDMERGNDMCRKRNLSTIIGVLALTMAAVGAIFSALPVGAKAATPKLVATVGPGYTITVRTASGAPARSVKPGLYAITVRDRSDSHNFHLTGPSVNKATSVDWVGTKTWRVRIVRGKTYRFVCDPHAEMMRGSFSGR